ncbi:MAG: ABC-type transport system, involved in lipoprotein release, permease component, partial [Pseudonocardia sp.]|nr:ABC-type transport system, involved in lipoprotein release, permease component [Pseudonocardia sp.]
MGIVAQWLRIDLRRRWRSLLVLALLIALASGTVLAAVAGARRGASAVDRLLAETLPATVVARTNTLGFDWSKVRAMPGVEAVSTFPGYTGFGVDEAPADTVQVYLPGDDQAMRTVERPVVLQGRLADPTRADEAVVTANFVDTYRRGVGAQVTVRLFTTEQVDTGVSAVKAAVVPRPEGPAVPVRIVGVVRSPWLTDGAGDPGRLIPSPGLIMAYRENL